LPFLPNPQVTTLEIGNVPDNMGALNLPCFFEGRVNLSIHTYTVNCPIFTIGFSRVPTPLEAESICHYYI
jgi:hypothetical protein